MKPVIAVSSCLLGNPVRYDGCAKPVQWITQQLATRVELVPLCPETGAGLGVPRPPVQLCNTPTGIRALGVADSSLDVTEALVQWSNQCLAQLPPLAACILKARSPSCGYLSTPLFDLAGAQLDSVSGLFAAALRESRPELLIVDEESLLTTAGRQRLLLALDLPVSLIG